MQKHEAALRLAGLDSSAQAYAPTNVHMITGEVVGKSDNGKVLVSMDGIVYSDEDAQYVEIDTVGGLQEGDTAQLILSGESGHAMVPLGIGSVGSVDRIRDSAEIAEGLAEQAKAVADATGQHFWSDDDGAHVTEVTQDEWNDEEGASYHSGPNSLWNSLGMLFRDGLNNLLALVTGDSPGVAIYDGDGNAAENISASFTRDGAQIGSSVSPHLSLDQTGIAGVNEDGLQLFNLEMDGSTITTQVRLKLMDHIFTGYPLDLTAPVRTFTTVLGGATGTVELDFQGFRFDFNQQLISQSGENVTLEPLTPYGYTVSGTFNLTDFDASSDYSYTGSVTAVARGEVNTNTVVVTLDYTAANSTVVIKVYGERTHGGGTWSLGFGWNYALFTSNIYAPAFSLGTRTEEAGVFSFTSGESIIAKGRDQVAFGRFNADDSSQALIIGNGTADDARSNALTVDWSGNIWAAGKAALSGAIEAASAAISGAITAASATISGALTASSVSTSGTYPFTYQDAEVDTSLSNNGLSAWKSRYLRFLDKAGRYYAWVTGGAGQDGSVQANLAARNFGTGANVDNVLSLGVTNSGTRTVSVSEAAPWRGALGLNLTTTSLNLTTTNIGGGTKTVYFAKQGNIVICTFTGWMNPSAANTAYTIGTIPSGYRPAREAYTYSRGVTNNIISTAAAEARWTFSTNGSITVVAGATGLYEHHFTAMWWTS